MWDCIPFATPEAIAHIKSLGGLKAIAVSHPHFYGAVADWSEAFGGVPVYLHGDDRKWVTRPHPAIVPWTGDSQRISDDILLVRTGGHFPGATVLHWRAGANGAAPCSPATSPWWRWTAARSASCTAFRTTSRSMRPRCAGSQAPSRRWRSTASTARGGAATSRPAVRRHSTPRCGDIWRRFRGLAR